MGQRTFTLQQLRRDPGDQVHGLLPRGVNEFGPISDQGPGQSITKLSLPAVQTFGSEAATVHSIFGPPPNPHHLPVFDGDVQTTAIAAQQAGGRYPVVNVVDGHSIDQMQVYPCGPGLPC